MQARLSLTQTLTLSLSQAEPEAAPSAAWVSRQDFVRRQLSATFTRLQFEGSPLLSALNRSAVVSALLLLPKLDRCW